MIWNKDQQTQHFIRKADFKTDAKDIGFIVPSPSRPQLNESGDAAFSRLAKITAPTQTHGGGWGIPLGCSGPTPQSLKRGVTVIEEKRVAGYDATVLTATSGKDLTKWLKENGYPYSPSVAAWAKPYLGGDWHFTALKIVKDKKLQQEQALKASALRITFKTDKPLFPYREPDSEVSSLVLTPKFPPFRLLRIYFIAESQYKGEINGKAWSGKTKWSGDITKHRKSLLTALKLDHTTGPKTWWLTEFEDQWPYEKAAGDLYFSPVAKPMIIDRDGNRSAHQLDLSFIAILFLACFLKLRKQA